MSMQCGVVARRAAGAAMGFFEPVVTTVLATVAGVPIEVPVMPASVRVIGRTRPWYERRSGVPGYAVCGPGDEGGAASA